MLNPIDESLRMGHQAKNSARRITDSRNIGRRPVEVIYGVRSIAAGVGQRQLITGLKLTQNRFIARHEFSLSVRDGQVHAIRVLQKDTLRRIGFQVHPAINKATGIVPSQRCGQALIRFCQQESRFD